MLRCVVVSVVLASLTGCGQPAKPVGESENPLRRVLVDNFQARAFSTGPVSIVATLDTFGSTPAITTYTVTPCRNMTFVCADGPNGQVGTAIQETDFTVISGTHSGLTFYLSPGGDGFVRSARGDSPLVWE